MKRIVFTVLALLCVSLMFAGKNIRQFTTANQKRSCVGYTIVESGKGVDCNGDTVRLVRVNGYYQVASAK